MGAGKTSVFSTLCTKKSLEGFRFYDTDTEIKKLFGIDSIQKFVSEHGWDRFREVEKEVIVSRLNEAENVVLALGGGSLNDEVLNVMRGCGAQLVWLRVELSEIMNRLSRGDTDRPLLRELSSVELMNLYKEREKNYSKADIIIDNTDIEETVGKLLKFLNSL